MYIIIYKFVIIYIKYLYILMDNNTFERPWGYYINTHEESGFKLKKIM